MVVGWSGDGGDEEVGAEEVLSDGCQNCHSSVHKTHALYNDMSTQLSDGCQMGVGSVSDAYKRGPEDHDGS